jgi:hypothetical protein
VGKGPGKDIVNVFKRDGVSNLTVKAQYAFGYCALLEQFEVDRRSHGEIAGAVGVKLVARAAGGALGNELGLEPAGVRVERRFVEIGDAVKYARGADEIR